MERGRREFLRAGACGLAGVIGTASAGCLGSGDGGAVSVLAAGSLQRALDARLRERVDDEFVLEAHGSAACARLVREGLRDPDVLALADPALFAGLCDRYTAFATNALVVAYDPDTPGGRAVRDADRAFDPLLEDPGEFRWGRSDPDADPLGYRTLFALRLAARRWDRPYPDALARRQVFPETELLAVFEAGALDAAVVYRNMAVDHGVPFRDLPPAVNLASPERSETYASVTYELPDGRTVRGAPIRYGATLRRTDPDPAVGRVFDALVDARWTGDAFTVPQSYPRVESVGG